MRGRIKLGMRFLLAAFMVMAGWGHFTNTAFYMAIMPPYLPAHLALVYISGVCEILGGVGLLIPQTRRAAAWGLVALFLAVFPANIHMAVNDIRPGGLADADFAPAMQYLRWPLQLVFLAWAYWFTKADATPEPVADTST